MPIEQGGTRGVEGDDTLLARLVRPLPDPPPAADCGAAAFDDRATGDVVLLSPSQITHAVSMRQQFDVEFARRLTAADEPLKPVLVDERTRWVLDGSHRVLAARLAGATVIPARLFRGDDMAALVEAVRCNLVHGRALTLYEREGAARAMLAARPEWSDRLVAELCGVSPKTVAALRSRSTGEIPRSSVRMGRDGRLRPLDPLEGRRRAAEVIAARPDAPLRVVAALAQTSQATALDVRRRLLQGHDPIPDRLARLSAAPDGTEAPPADAGRPSTTGDPAFSTSDKLAAFAAWFEAHAVCDADWAGVVDALPVSRLYEMIDRAAVWQASWNAFLDALRRRAHQNRRIPDTRL